MMKLFTATLTAIACLAGSSPALAMTPGECTDQQGRTITQIQDALGEGKLIHASAATEFSDAMESYTFGNYFTGSCLVMMRRGFAEYVTYTKF